MGKRRVVQILIGIGKKATINETEDVEYSLRGILDGSRYLPGEFGPPDSEGDDFPIEPTFGTQLTLERASNDTAAFRLPERELVLHE